MFPKKALLWQYFRSIERSRHEDVSVLGRVVDLYGLGRNRIYKPAGDGFSSKTYIMTSKQGKWALKQYRRQIQQQDILFIHSLLIQLERQSFPASHLYLTPDGRDFVTMDGRCYALFDYELGYRGDLFKMTQPLRRRHIKQAGNALARFHKLTKNMILRGRRNQGYKATNTDERWDSYNDYTGEWRELVSRSFQRNRVALIPDTTSNYIADKMTDLAQEKSSQPLLPVSIIHGDYGPWNLLFRPFAVLNSIIDFDDVCLEERIEEVAASLISFAGIKSNNKPTLNVEDGRVFLESYHQEYNLTHDELHALPRAFECFLLKRALTILRMYLQFKQKADHQKLLNIIFWLTWLDNSGFTILQKITSPILEVCSGIEDQ